MDKYIINGELVDKFDVKELKKRNKPEKLGLNFAILEKPRFENENYIHFVTRSSKEKLHVVQNGKCKVMKLYTNRKTVTMPFREYFNSKYAGSREWQLCRTESTFDENGIYVLERFNNIITDPKQIIHWLNNNY
jgi:hypothetical protein